MSGNRHQLVLMGFASIKQPALAVILLPQDHFCFRFPACMRGLAPLALALLLPYTVLPLARQLGTAHAPVHKFSDFHCLCCFLPCTSISPWLERSHCWCLGTLLQPTSITELCKSGLLSMKPAHESSLHKPSCASTHALLQAKTAPHHLKRASIVLPAWLSVRQLPSHHPHRPQYGTALVLQR